MALPLRSLHRSSGRGRVQKSADSGAPRALRPRVPGAGLEVVEHEPPLLARQVGARAVTFQGPGPPLAGLLARMAQAVAGGAVTAVEPFPGRVRVRGAGRA